jgi:hypothetical protein
MLYPDYDPLTDEIDNAGCFLQPSKLASIAACFAEPSGGMTPERTIEKIGDALSSAWDKEMLKYEPFRQMQAYYFNNSKAMSQASILRSVDEIASIGGGRATNLAHFVHFSANPAFFSYSFQQVQAADLAVARQMAEQYLNRGRMVAVVVEPLSDEEKARRKARVSAGEENASYHGTSAKDEFDFAFDVSQITPETIERVMVVPDRSKIKELTLDNGLKVSVMSYGEAPVVRVGLFVHGDDMNAPQYGLDRFSEALSYRASKQSASESLMQVAGDSYEMPMTLGRMLWAEGSSGNLDAVLRQLRLQVEQLDLVMADKSQQIKIWRKASRSAGKDPKTWAARLSNQVLFGKDHPLGRYMDATTFDAMEDWGADEIKSWMATKYQPKNANLVVVGESRWADDRHAVDGVHGFGRLGGEELASVMASAEALVFLPFFEGFGVPVVEAFACGTPVIASSLTALPEVCGGAAAALIDPTAPDAADQVAEAMFSLERDPVHRAAAVEAGLRRAADFSWDRSATLLWEAIQAQLDPL